MSQHTSAEPTAHQPGAERDRETESARAVARDALVRIERDGAYANLVLPGMLDRSRLADRDRRFATELTYGATRRRRSLDHLLDRHLRHRPDPETMAVLRLGTYQLLATNVPAHAAVDTSVGMAPQRTRRLVNAVLRRVSTDVAGGPVIWPSRAVELSYPDWIVDRLTADLGDARAWAALEAMNVARGATRREDGYVQDPASQWVAALVAADGPPVVLDLCAGPGGKATAIASAATSIIAADLRRHRVDLVVANARAVDRADRLHAVVADAAAGPWRRAAASSVLVDAPCSGLGVLGRRPDARWRVERGDVEDLATLQRRILTEAARILAPGGTLTYSVCTMTRAETTDIDDWLADRHPDLVPLDPPEAPWLPHGRGALVLPQDQGTDAMFVLRLRSSATAG